MHDRISVANAPCSWGTLEFEGVADAPIGYSRMLDELAVTGYAGTELGDWGYMPTDPAALRRELEKRQISLRGAFVPVALSEPSSHQEGTERALRTAQLLAAAGDAADPPFIVLSDANGEDPTRTKQAGRVTVALEPSPDAWDVIARGATRIAQTVLDETGLRTVFHHHCAGFIESPHEISHFLELTDPDLIGLVFDTGHFLYGSGSNATSVGSGLEAFADRIWHLHFKDCAPSVATAARVEEWDYFEAVKHGVFCELGRGCVDFEDVVDWLQVTGYSGWIVVEQDVLPGMGSPRESAARNRAYLKSIGL